jgi:hypothetical protein
MVEQPLNVAALTQMVIPTSVRTARVAEAVVDPTNVQPLFGYVSLSPLAVGLTPEVVLFGATIRSTTCLEQCFCADLDSFFSRHV